MNTCYMVRVTYSFQECEYRISLIGIGCLSVCEMVAIPVHYVTLYGVVLEKESLQYRRNTMALSGLVDIEWSMYPSSLKSWLVDVKRYARD